MQIVQVLRLATSLTAARPYQRLRLLHSRYAPKALSIVFTGISIGLPDKNPVPSPATLLAPRTSPYHGTLTDFAAWHIGPCHGAGFAERASFRETLWV